MAFENNHIDDTILIRSDGTPTYILASVVDDHDMNISHIIRGDDHLTNTAKQQIIFESLNWKIPQMIHIPLIYGPDGSKLSKRHGALGVDQYEKLGYLPEALNNYLLKLGFFSGNQEFISRDEAIELFDTKNLGKAPARIDFKKMQSINNHYINQLDDNKCLEIILIKIDKKKSTKFITNKKKALPEI